MWIPTKWYEKNCNPTHIWDSMKSLDWFIKQSLDVTNRRQFSYKNSKNYSTVNFFSSRNLWKWLIFWSLTKFQFQFLIGRYTDREANTCHIIAWIESHFSLYFHELAIGIHKSIGTMSGRQGGKLKPLWVIRCIRMIKN